MLWEKMKSQIKDSFEDCLALFGKAIKMHPSLLARKVCRKIFTKISDCFQRNIDIKMGTTISFKVPLIKDSYISLDSIEFQSVPPEVAFYLAQMYCEHRFDLLGSGWVKNSFSSEPIGIEGVKYKMNLEELKISPRAYEQIDWQKDVKSGYRWNKKAWYKDHRNGNAIGSDIKLPWELARLQHLPQLAVFTLLETSNKTQNLKEFRNQVLDFIQNNPPRMGVNWACTMDVGIRAANILIAYDIFNQIDDDSILDEDFKQNFANSIYEHGLHIVNNLEYSDGFTSNHYLSDIAGLLFISVYLETTHETTQWLAFSLQEIISEMKNQFYEDGGNFESSTSYHRLSGELMVFSSALILGLESCKVSLLKSYSSENWRFMPPLKPLDQQEYSIDLYGKIIFPQWFVDRLYRIGRFTVDILKPNREVPQFGDNDSGRFFRFSPVGEFLSNRRAAQKYRNLEGYTLDEEKYWDENILDHSTIVACFSGIFRDEIFQTHLSLERSIIKALAKRELICSEKSYKGKKNDNVTQESLEFSKETTYQFPSMVGALDFFAYPDSGLYIFKNCLFYLAINISPNGQGGWGGHTHNDKLNFELHFDGKDIVKDPGTYLYTPFPEIRNKFRGTSAHNVPLIDGEEQADWIEGPLGLFNLLNFCACKVLRIDKRGIVLFAEYKNVRIIRSFQINESSLKIIDKCNCAFSYYYFPFYSNGYGKLLRTF